VLVGRPDVAAADDEGRGGRFARELRRTGRQLRRTGRQLRRTGRQLGGQDAAKDVVTTSDSGDGGDSALCIQYCDELDANCTGGNAQYANRAACLTTCKGFTVGDPSDVSGNTLYCRIYHGGAPAVADPGTHCAHAGPTGGGQCS
jgi:hypothetical protein